MLTIFATQVLLALVFSFSDRSLGNPWFTCMGLEALCAMPATRGLFAPPTGMREFPAGAGGNLHAPVMATATKFVATLIVAVMLARKRFVEGIILSGIT